MLSLCFIDWSREAKINCYFDELFSSFGLTEACGWCRFKR
jgi:predicted 3-demethylubiquinone-9 3-methyltransferase (glyoxalase superfamily)